MEQCTVLWLARFTELMAKRKIPWSVTCSFRKKNLWNLLPALKCNLEPGLKAWFFPPGRQEFPPAFATHVIFAWRKMSQLSGIAWWLSSLDSQHTTDPCWIHRSSYPRSMWVNYIRWVVLLKKPLERQWYTISFFGGGPSHPPLLVTLWLDSLFSHPHREENFPESWSIPGSWWLGSQLNLHAFRGKCCQTLNYPGSGSGFPPLLQLSWDQAHQHFRASPIILALTNHGLVT